jgi:hypothetical protein
MLICAVTSPADARASLSPVDDIAIPPGWHGHSRKSSPDGHAQSISTVSFRHFFLLVSERKQPNSQNNSVFSGS